jgi:hypothetical protein
MDLRRLKLIPMRSSICLVLIFVFCSCHSIKMQSTEKQTSVANVFNIDSIPVHYHNIALSVQIDSGGLAVGNLITTLSSISKLEKSQFVINLDSTSRFKKYSIIKNWDSLYFDDFQPTLLRKSITDSFQLPSDFQLIGRCKNECLIYINTDYSIYEQFCIINMEFKKQHYYAWIDEVGVFVLIQ